MGAVQIGTNFCLPPSPLTPSPVCSCGQRGGWRVHAGTGQTSDTKSWVLGVQDGAPAAVEPAKGGAKGRCGVDTGLQAAGTAHQHNSKSDSCT
jgi:hypothetical protein